MTCIRKNKWKKTTINIFINFLSPFPLFCFFVKSTLTIYGYGALWDNINSFNFAYLNSSGKVESVQCDMYIFLSICLGFKFVYMNKLFSAL